MYRIHLDAKSPFMQPVNDNYNVKSPKYVCITAYRPWHWI